MQTVTEHGNSSSSEVQAITNAVVNIYHDIADVEMQSLKGHVTTCYNIEMKNLIYSIYK